MHSCLNIGFHFLVYSLLQATCDTMDENESLLSDFKNGMRKYPEKYIHMQLTIDQYGNLTEIISLKNPSATSGFPPIREIREFRENFEDFFQSGKSGKNGFFSQNQGKKFQIRELFSKPFSNLLNL